jgi:Carboxypeptidase regulatory-like domain/TonB dependent receptor
MKRRNLIIRRLVSRFLGLRTAFQLTLVMVLAATIAFGQSSVSTGSIQGSVQDPSGAVVPNAKVTITNAGTGQRIDKVTTSSGTFSTGPLQSGVYKVRVEAPSFQSAEQPVNVQVGVSSAANFTLTLGSSAQTVEVTGEAVRVNTEQPSVQGVLTSQQIDTLPVNGRNFLDLAQLEPGVQIQDGGNFDPTKNGFSSISFGGRAGRTARINVDGIDISDETVGTTTQDISAGAISEFQLSQSTLDLSTELTSSGAVNIMTKSGTNSYHGDGFYYGRNKPYGFAKFPGDTAGDGVRYQRNQMGGSFGGALVRDHLFFFLQGERTKQDQQIAIVPDGIFRGVLPNTYPAFHRDNTSNARLDWQGPHGLRVFYRFGYNVLNSAYAFGSTYQPFINRNQTPAHTVGADFTTGNYTHSIRFGFFKFQNHIADAVLGNAGIFNPGAAAAFPVDIRIGPAGVAERFGPSRLAPQATFQANHQIKYDGSHLWGKHILRYGVDFNGIRGGGFAAFYGLAPEMRTPNSGSPTDPTTAQGFAQLGPYPGGATNPLNYQMTSLLLSNGQGFFTEQPAFNYPAGGQQDDRFAFYLGDSWKFHPNLTFTYGVRYSRDTGRADSDLAPLTCDQIDPTLFSQLPCTGKSLILDQFGGNFGGRVNQPNANWGPQVGFAWDPRGNGKTSIRGGAGLYYENAIFNNVLFDRPGRLPQGLFWGTTNPCSSGTLLGSPTFTYNGTAYDIATQICGQRVGDVMSVVGAMQKFYQAQIAAAGPAANPNFIGSTLANGNNSTGNNFIAPDYKTPMSIQMNIGIQHELRPGLIVSADFLRNVGLHYLLAVDTNHVGDARYLNVPAAQNAIAATTSGFGCGVGTPAAIDCAIAAGATIADFAGNGLDTGAWFLSGFPSSAFGLDPTQGAAFPGINPLVGENTMLFPTGRSVYTGLQLKLQHNIASPIRGLSAFNYTVSYSLSRFNTMTGDQDFVNTASDFRRPNQYFGPGSLDRTSQLSFGGSVQIKHGPQLSFISHFFSPLSVTPFLDEPGSAGFIFTSDLTGDGTWGDILPGAKNGSFGRDYNGAGINSAINAYNTQFGGKLTPAGQALVAAGVISAPQLIALGGAAYTVPTAPTDQAGLGWLKTTDLKLDWPIKIGERVTLHPNVGFYNAFNFANFDSASNMMSGDLYGAGGAINGTSKSLGDHETNRTGSGTGVNTIGAPRQMEFGLRIVF